jgi:hypothetical protein
MMMEAETVSETLFFKKMEDEEYRLLGCSTVWLWFKPTFGRNVSPPSSG